MKLQNIQRSIKNNFKTNPNLNYYILNGVFFTFMSSFSKSYAVKFLYRIGGNEFHVSLFNALPGLIAVFATLPGIIWINNTINKKSSMGKTFAASRLITLLFAFIPFLPPTLQPFLFVLLTALINFPESVSVTALQSYTGDIFLPKQRANAISLRNKFSTLAQLISFLILGQILSSHSDTNETIIKKYQLFFVAAFIMGIFEIICFYKLKETSCTKKINISINSALKETFKNKKFIIFIICSLLFHFGWQMGWSLFSIYQIDYLGADEKWLTILNVTSSVVMFFSFNYWHKLINKKGNSFVIAVTTFFMALTPILFVLSPNLYIMTVTGLATGFFTAGTIVVILNSLLEVVPEDKRMLYVSVHSTLTNVTLAIGPMFSNLILVHSSIQIALIATAFFRLVGSAAFFIRNKTTKMR
jgi:predicted MFS family arabinose efflux permease